MLPGIFTLRGFPAVCPETVVVVVLSGHAFENFIETLKDSSQKKFFNVPKLGGTKYGNVAYIFLKFVLSCICRAHLHLALRCNTCRYESYLALLRGLYVVVWGEE